jgi:ABC-2 type transport system permease protein
VPIFDQGYQHWKGTLSGHAWRGLVISRHGMRVGRQNRFVRMLILVSWLPAIGLAGALSIWGLLERSSDLIRPLLPFISGFVNPAVLRDPRAFRVEAWTICYDYFLLTEMYLSMILVLLVGPSLISQDLRFNALPLYFSRPLRRLDYFAGKLGVIVGFIGMVTIVPSLIAYVLGLLFSLDFSIFKDTFGLLLCSIAYGLLIAVCSGTLMLAMSCVSRNSRYVGLFWIGFWILSGTVSGILIGIDTQARQRNAYLATQAEMQASRQNRGGRSSGPRSSGFEDFMSRELEASKTDWRPLISYTANLRRMESQILGTNKAWEKISEIQLPGQREAMQFTFMSPQYPWYWSAGVLAGLFVISAGVLNFRIKSLDRLK